MFTSGYRVTIPPMVSVYTKGIGWSVEDILPAAPTSNAYESAARAVYMPIILPTPCVVRRVWWSNGATTSGGATIEVGIYADSGSYSPGAKIASGSATQGTASQVQFVDVTDVALPPGLFWIAIVSSSATSTTLFRAQTIGGLASGDALARFEEESASPLPATATPVEATVGNIYLCGFSTTASP
jgi:hypothetical protein